MKMPVEVFLDGMDLLLRSMRQLQTVYNDTADALLPVGPSRPPGPLPEGTADPTPVDRPGLAGALLTTWNDPPPAPPIPEENATVYGSDYDDNLLCGDDLKRVAYSIWFKKPDFAVLLLDQGFDLIDYPTDGESFAAIKVAEFFRTLRKDGIDIPERWKGDNHPRGDYDYVLDPITGLPTKFKDIPPDDRRYIQFEFEVTKRQEKPPTEYDKFQTRAQEKQAKQQQDIANAIGKLPKLLEEIKEEIKDSYS